MNVDLPYTTVEECIEAGVAKEIEGRDAKGNLVGAECADLDCHNQTPIAWVWQSQVFKYKEGRLLMLPVTLWFPLCPLHAPLQEEDVIETTATEVPLATE